MTRREKALIRGYHPEYQLQFRADGKTWARPGAGRAWGVLYTRDQTSAVALALVTGSGSGDGNGNGNGYGYGYGDGSAVGGVE